MADRPEDTTAAARPRPLEQIFPLRGDANRGREMQATWRSFCRDRSPMVKSVLAGGRSSPEIAYQLGELLHNHFRTRGVTLTSYELRRLVSELLARHGSHADREDKSPVDDAEPRPLVRAPDSTSQPPASSTPMVPVREPAPFEQLLIRALELVRGRLVSRDRQAARAAVDEAVKSIAREQGGELPSATRERLMVSVLSEVIGLGLIDRLWADPTVSAILVHGPSSVFVERDGTLQGITEGFRDRAHLLEQMERLAGRPASGVADLRLRDGSTGVVIFPPVAPEGPVLALRRFQPGEATLDRLVASGALDRPVADLLRLGARSSLNMVITGPSRSGKTALLAAVAREFDSVLRVVTVARHRQFRWPAGSKIELVTSREVSFAALMEASERLKPELLVLDSVDVEEVAALCGRLVRGASGMLASLRPDAMSALPAHSVDLVVRIDRGGVERFGVAAVEDAAGDAVFRREGGKLVRGKASPVFAAVVRDRGYGEALARLLN
ncbi:MAG: CpaF family protein [Enhydrobacter sp.]|nr:CpaF family protein [Enhydrobacter sp.]